MASDDFNEEHYKPAAEMTDEILLEVLKKAFTAEPIPPCRVCGRALEFSSAGGGNVTKYACSGLVDDPENPGKSKMLEGRSLGDEHYNTSVFKHFYVGDSRVMELVKRFEDMKANVAFSQLLRTN